MTITEALSQKKRIRRKPNTESKGKRAYHAQDWQDPSRFSIANKTYTLELNLYLEDIVATDWEVENIVSRTEAADALKTAINENFHTQITHDLSYDEICSQRYTENPERKLIRRVLDLLGL